MSRIGGTGSFSGYLYFKFPFRPWLRKGFGLYRREPENLSGLPEAELSSEEEHEAQEEYGRKHPT